MEHLLMCFKIFYRACVSKNYILVAVLRKVHWGIDWYFFLAGYSSVSWGCSKLWVKFSFWALASHRGSMMCSFNSCIMLLQDLTFCFSLERSFYQWRFVTLIALLEIMTGRKTGPGTSKNLGLYKDSMSTTYLDWPKNVGFKPHEPHYPSHWNLLSWRLFSPSLTRESII